MSANTPAQRSFDCPSCQKEIKIPYDLPATVAPCPHCGTQIQSPAPPTSTATPTQQTPSQPQAQQTAQAATASNQPVRDTQLNSPANTNTAPSYSKKGFPWGLLSLIAIPLLLLAAFFAYKFEKNRREQKRIAIYNAAQKEAIEAGIQGAELSIEERKYLREGWRIDTTEVLGKFLTAKSPADKAKYIIGGKNRLSDLEAFYIENPNDDSETPLDAFSHVNLSYDDMKYGIFQMSYNRPRHYELANLFSPIIPTGVKFGLEPPNLLYSTIDTSQFFSQSQNIAAFFKRKDDKLLLDWDTYVQSKHRLLSKFADSPQQGKTSVFRVFISQGIMPPHGFDVKDNEVVYVIKDSSAEGLIRVIVDKNSKLAQTLSSINWVGETNFIARTATVELEWQQRNGQPIIALKDIICWEFLGIGGDPSNLEQAAATQ